MPTFHDVSVPVSPGIPVYRGDPPVSLALAHAMARGDPADVTRIDMGAHTGTHVDAPSHFLPGARTVDQLPLEALLGPCRVVDLRGVHRIGPADLERATAGHADERLLLKTDNSALWAQGAFQERYAAVTRDGARWLADRGCRLVGIDYLSIAPFEDPAGPHRVLLEAGVVILEGLDLSAVDPGPYRLICLPLRLAGAEGAPARAVLVSEP